MQAEVLGVIDEKGDVIINRYHSAATRIMGNDFYVVCEKCNSAVRIYKERRQNEITREWYLGVFRQPLNGTVETVGTFSGSL